jgi:hypothetical protein
MEIINVGCEDGTEFVYIIPINSSLQMVIIDIHLLLQILNDLHTQRTNLPLQFLKQNSNQSLKSINSHKIQTESIY